MERIAEREAERITAKCQRFQERQGYILRWVERGTGGWFSRAEKLERRIQMLLGIFLAKGMLPLECTPAFGVRLTRHPLNAIGMPSGIDAYYRDKSLPKSMAVMAVIAIQRPLRRA
jgi:hypothetical protein